MGEHLTPDGRFKSDKLEWCHEGYFALSFTDPLAQPLIWRYADSVDGIDPELARDLRHALRREGYDPEHCSCVFECGKDSQSGHWHQHEDEPCKMHPYQVMVG